MSDVDAVATLMRAHQLWRKQLPTRGSYGPTLSSNPPARIIDGKKVAVPPYWWCKTCGVEFPQDDERPWEVMQTHHQAETVLAWLAERAR